MKIMSILVAEVEGEDPEINVASTCKIMGVRAG